MVDQNFTSTSVAPVTLTLTFIYELYPYSLEIYQMCKYEILTPRLLKVII